MTTTPDDSGRRSYSVDEFCRRNRISRSLLYQQWRECIGPRYYYAGRCRRITTDAEDEYLRAREQACAAEWGRAPEAA